MSAGPARLSPRSSGVDPSTPRPARSRVRLPTALCVLAAAAVSAAPVAGAEGHRFTAVYRGHGRAARRGRVRPGTATASGRSNLLGPGTLSGSARGTVTSETCVVFELDERRFAARRPRSTLTARDAKACAAGSDVSTVSFSGTAKVTGAGLLAYGRPWHPVLQGTYVRQTGVVTISSRAGSSTDRGVPWIAVRVLAGWLSPRRAPGTGAAVSAETAGRVEADSLRAETPSRDGGVRAPPLRAVAG